MTQASGPVVLLAVDPGRCKCGYVVMEWIPGEKQGRILERGIVTADDLLDVRARWMQSVPELKLILGSGTGHRAALACMKISADECCLVDERLTTMRARERYFKENPPRGWRRLIPVGLLCPPGPWDDWAALVLAEDWIASAG